MTDQLIELGIAFLILFGLVRIVVALGHHSSSDDLKGLLGEALSLKTGRSLSDLEE